MHLVGDRVKNGLFSIDGLWYENWFINTWLRFVNSVTLLKVFDDGVNIYTFTFAAIVTAAATILAYVEEHELRVSFSRLFIIEAFVLLCFDLDQLSFACFLVKSFLE